MRSINQSIVFLLITVFLVGCSASNIAQRGEYIDQQSIKIGTPRSSVLARFGAPADTIIKDGVKVDVYRVVQGERSGSKKS